MVLAVVQTARGKSEWDSFILIIPSKELAMRQSANSLLGDPVF